MKKPKENLSNKDGADNVRTRWCLPGKLVLAESQYIASDLSHDFTLILGSAVLQNVLDHVVAILVLNKTNRRHIN